MAKFSKKIPKDLQTDWDDEPGKKRFSRINRMMASNDTRQLNSYDTSTKNEDPMPNYSTIYGLKNKKWSELGKKCLDCGKVLSDTKAIEVHPELCLRTLKINKESNTEEQEILSKVKRSKIDANSQD